MHKYNVLQDLTADVDQVEAPTGSVIELSDDQAAPLLAAGKVALATAPTPPATESAAQKNSDADEAERLEGTDVDPNDKGVSVLDKDEKVVNTYYGATAQANAQSVADKLGGTVRVN